MSKKVVLAFSGGLDTSYCAVYLKSKGYEIHSVTVDTGGFSNDELNEISSRAVELGSVSHKIIDARNDLYTKCIRYLIFGNVLKNNTYPLSVSAERTVQAIAIAEYARLINAQAIAHGSTGAGNDQVRFDMVFNIMVPELEIITPIRDRKLSRNDEIEFLRSKGVNMNFEKARYSINKGMWGTSIGGSETLTSDLTLPEDAYPSQVIKSEPLEITLEFIKGELFRMNGVKYDNPVDLVNNLNEIGSSYAIGRDMHVGDTIIGIKGRVGFEAPAALMIIKAHHLLEKHTLTKWQLYWKDQLSAWYGNWLHEGQFLDPAMRDIESFMKHTQNHVCGKVTMVLHPYRFVLKGIESPFDLMNNAFGSYGEMNNSWTGEDVKGFTKIFGNQTFIYNKIKAHDSINA